MRLSRTGHFSLLALCLLLHEVQSQVMSMSSAANRTGEVTKVLRRHKRYLAFPEGSSVSVAPFA
uniref:Uncharacterized protein, isoform B n=1 Tax=Drosophila melanogaster TaxID=7227 RepID=A0A0B4LHK6_DROME|nr:uncharacterized protein Dmel_CG13616, isoform B [Drosophila melanogaster]AHN57503.1 uncharacterized protein Dmel_CG13616, isoform B [Drosophila melanogaster]|eukprot:NP_001287504.1 uncharacterized protein Dmel_CG13616, isoform B [Drosophila melanogaster]